MKNFWQFIFVFMVLISVLFVGILIDRHFLRTANMPHHYAENDMHKLFHDLLGVTKEQDEKLVTIEKNYQNRKNFLENEIKIANISLANKIKESGYISADTQVSVDEIHKAMGELQKLTLQHLADMQDILEKEQNEKLKEKVIEQLYRNAGQ